MMENTALPLKTDGINFALASMNFAPEAVLTDPIKRIKPVNFAAHHLLKIKAWFK